MTFEPKKILAATDFSAGGTRAVDAAFDLAERYRATLTLVHVIPPSAYLDFASGIEGQAIASIDYQEAVREAVKESWRNEEARVRPRGIGVECLTRTGPPALEIAALAKDGGFDLVVLGTHGRSGLKHVLLGSVAEGVVRHTMVPVLMLRTP